MKNEGLISVIVPVYSVEEYLEKCVNSIINQTYKNLEIILVDDGTPDNCGKICDEFALRDNRVKVIHKTNGGLSSARNAGLDIMTGDYVAFVDSDDWIEDNMYECLLNNLVEFDADMSFGGVADELEGENGYKIAKISDYGCKEPFSEDIIDAMRRYFHGTWAAWDKLYKASLFETIRFPVGEINEDEAIVIDLLSLCDKICYTPEVLYHYIKHKDSNSITSAPFSEKKLAWFRHCESNLKYIEKHYPELYFDAAYRYRGSIMWSLTEMALSEEYCGYRKDSQTLLQKLRERRTTFSQIPFYGMKEHIRYLILLYMGYDLYKIFIKIVRKFSL